MDWYIGLYFIGMGLMFVLVFHFNKNNTEFITKLQTSLTYDLLIFLVSLCVIGYGLQLLGVPISKQLWKSARVRQWYIAYKAKQDLRKRNVR